MSAVIGETQLGLNTTLLVTVLIASVGEALPEMMQSIPKLSDSRLYGVDACRKTKETYSANQDRDDEGCEVTLISIQRRLVLLWFKKFKSIPSERLSTTKEQHLLFRSKLEAFWERDEQERGTAPCALSALAGVKDNFSTPVSQNCLL